MVLLVTVPSETLGVTVVVVVVVVVVCGGVGVVGVVVVPTGSLFNRVG